ncbi:MAG: ribulose-phosphate 3-epimerase [Planctomycetota bacterium]|nr:MAG: ribulose-phosphate 3-epimerase [Planctomycetota bacterium]
MSLPAVKIAPSLLSADFAHLARDVAAVEAAGADWLHVDVMDGHFVPNLTIGPPVVAALKRVATRPLDVHIMIRNPLEFAERYVAAGADVLSCHVETEPAALAAIRDAGALAGLAINPDTDVGLLREHLGQFDLALVMSVQPGFGGQSFRPEVLSKVEALRAWGFEGDIEVDGGIAPATIGDAAAAGANVFVAGSAVFKSDDWSATIAVMREAALSAHATRA